MSKSLPLLSFSPCLQQPDDCPQPTNLKIKTETPACKTEPSSPSQCPTEDQNQPMDLSLNKPRMSSHTVSVTNTTVNPPPSSTATQPSLTATPVPSAVQSIGSMVNNNHWYSHGVGWRTITETDRLYLPPRGRSSHRVLSWLHRAPGASRSCTSSTPSPPSACPVRWASCRPSLWWCSHCRSSTLRCPQMA